MRADACKKLGGIERLGDRIVGSEIEGCRAILGSRADEQDHADLLRRSRPTDGRDHIMHMERRVLSSLDIRYRARKGAQEKQLWQELARGLEPLLSRCKCDYVEARTLQYHLQGVAARRIRFDDYNSLRSVAHRALAFRPRQLRTRAAPPPARMCILL